MSEWYPSFDANIVYSQLRAGKPTLIHYVWGEQHWVCVIGVRAGATINNLQPSDFIVIDPASGTEKALTECSWFGSAYKIEMKTMN